MSRMKDFDIELREAGLDPYEVFDRLNDTWDSLTMEEEEWLLSNMSVSNGEMNEYFNDPNNNPY